MSWTLGRASFTNDPSSVSHDGDRLTIAFNILPSTLAEAKVMRQQVLGVADNVDEPVIPVTMANDADYDGFYRVRSAQVEPVSNYRTSRLMRAQVSLERVAGGYAQPTVETYIVSTVATNAQSVSSPTWAISDAAPTSISSLGYRPFTTTLSSKNNVDGVDIQRAFFTSSSFSGTSYSFYPPDKFYTGACRLEIQVGGSWYPVAGKQLPERSNYDAWRIHNTLISLGDEDGDDYLNFRRANSSAWTAHDHKIVCGTITTGTFTKSTGTDLVGSATAGPFVLRNSPEMIVVRHFDGGSMFTYSIWTGATIAVIHWESLNSNFRRAIGMDSADAGTAITGGIKDSVADADGNKYVLLLREDEQIDTTRGAVGLATTGLSATFGVGIDIGGAETNAESDAGLLEQLCTPPNWLRIVGAQ